jgi:hypothetical protein
MSHVDFEGPPPKKRRFFFAEEPIELSDDEASTKSAPVPADEADLPLESRQNGSARDSNGVQTGFDSQIFAAVVGDHGLSHEDLQKLQDASGGNLERG